MSGRLVSVIVLGLAAVLALPSNATVHADAAPSDSVIPPERVFVHDASGFLGALPPGFSDPIDFRVSRVGSAVAGANGPEPSTGIDSSGRIFFQALTRTWRSSDDGLSWSDVTPATASATTNDPMLWLDPVTDRVYADQLQGSCTQAVWSDFGGDVWNGAGFVFCPAANYGTLFDHQKVTTGPIPPDYLRDANPLSTLGHLATFFGWNSAGQSHMAMSLDEGMTFLTSTVTASGTCSGGLHGRMRQLSDGTMLVPKRDCNAPQVEVSRDFSVWRHISVGATAGSTQHRKNADLAVDKSDNAYLFWAGADERTYMAHSSDGGLTWSAPVRASPPNVLSSTFQASVAGDAGKVAVMYYGNDHSAAAPDHVDYTSRWHAFISYSLNALDANPTWVTVQLDTDADPIQIGPISTNSDGHAPSGSRNLLDFNDLVMRADGRVVAAYADGCTTLRSCSTNPNAVLTDSRDAKGVSAIELGGPRLTG